jgi:UDP-N-acetylglucosamine 2-epimerase
LPQAASKANAFPADPRDGNTGIDALIEARGSSSTGSPASDRKLLLVTCHRRENWHRLEEVAAALKRLVRLLPVEVAFLLHTNPRLRQAAQAALAGEPHIKLLDPVAHREMVSLMDRSWAILTDSGGVQEEGPALGKPVLVLRHVTERAEALDTRNIELVGTDPDRIFGAVARLLRDPARYRLMAQPSFPFGDGNAAPRIAALVDDFLADRASLAVAETLQLTVTLSLRNQPRGQ